MASTSFAQDQGPYFELIETIPDDVGGDKSWIVSDGHITLKSGNGDYGAEMTWSAPPRTSDKAGFSMTLNIEGKANPSRIYAGVGVYSSGGFTFDKDPPGADVSVPDAAPGGSDSRSSSISVQVTPSTSYSDGSIIELRVGAYYGPGIAYRYRVSSTPVTGQPQGPGQQQGQLMATVSCDARALVISQLPSVTCQLMISGFRRNTADPVEVILPQMLDQFGNHANGIQLIDADGAEDVFSWDSPHRWPFFIFACPGQSGTGANCYGNAAVPGTATVPIIVRQKGMNDANVPLVLNVVARGTPPVVGGGGQIVRIGNRWIAGSFINIEPGALTNSSILLDWLSARWALEPVAGTEFVRLRSEWKPDLYVHTENGQIETGPIRPEWESAMWAIENVGNSGYVRFRNRWRSDQYLNTESGILASTPIQQEWLSAMWWLLQ